MRDREQVVVLVEEHRGVVHHDVHRAEPLVGRASGGSDGRRRAWRSRRGRSVPRAGPARVIGGRYLFPPRNAKAGEHLAPRLQLAQRPWLRGRLASNSKLLLKHVSGKRAAVPAAGFEPARAFAQTLARRPRLPFPPRRHHAVADHDRAEAPERAPRKCYRATARGERTDE